MQFTPYQLQLRLVCNSLIWNDVSVNILSIKQGIMALGVIGLFSSIIIGILLGYVLQRGRACTNTAFRNLLLIGNAELAIMIVIVVCVEIIGYFILSLNFLPNFFFKENPIPLSYLLVPLGGFIFGLGTVFAGGCAGGICYRIGQGSVASLLGFFGFATGIGIIGVILASPVETIRNQTLIVDHNGQSPSLSLFLPRWVWTLLAIIFLGSAIYYYKKKANSKELKLTHLLSNWPPIKTGLFIGLLGVGARYFSTISGREFGLSTTDGIAEIFQSLLTFNPLGWAGVFILSLIVGSAISSLLGNEFQLSIPTGLEIARFFGGGLLLGIGAMLGLGCNFGHIFGGIPELGISSFISVIFMIGGNWTGSYLFYVRAGVEFPVSTPNITKA